MIRHRRCVSGAGRLTFWSSATWELADASRQRSAQMTGAASEGGNANSSGELPSTTLGRSGKTRSEPGKVVNHVACERIDSQRLRLLLCHAATHHGTTLPR
jgi:hypothetical protein